MPRRDKATRWNSWYEMLNRAINHLKTPILQTIHEEIGLAKDNLSHTEWQSLTHIRDFLKGFYDTTKATKGRKATLDKVLPSLDFMAMKFEVAIKQFRDNDDVFIVSRLHAGYSKVLKYWNRAERAPVYIAAIVLDPTLKWAYFDDWNPDWQPRMREKLKHLWETSYRPSYIVQTNPPRQQITNNEYILWMQQRRSVQGISDDLEQYLSEPCLVTNDRTALDW